MTADLLLSQAIKVFLIARSADSYSPSTLAQYKWALDRFVLQQDKRIDEINTSDIRQFLSYLQTDYEPVRPNGDASPLSSSSLFAAWKAIRAFYKWACPEFGIPNPSMKIPPPRHMASVIVPFVQDEIKSLLKACERTKLSTSTKKSFSMQRPTYYRDRAILLTLLDTGLRVSELCRLTINDCNLQTGEIIVNPFGSGIKSRSRIVPLGASSRKAISIYLAHFPNIDKVPLFRKANEDALDRYNVLKMIVALGERAGVRNVHPHRFRHTFGIMYLRNGGDLFTLQRLLGHTSLTMTQHYLALAKSDDVAAHKKASPVDNWKL